MAGVTWNCCRLGAGSVYTIQPCTMSRHFMQSHIRRMHACLAVSCQLLFLQNDRDLLRATAVTRGWSGYRKKESAQEADPGEENSCRSSRDSILRPFHHESGALTTELSPLPLSPNVPIPRIESRPVPLYILPQEIKQHVRLLLRKRERGKVKIR